MHYLYLGVLGNMRIVCSGLGYWGFARLGQYTNSSIRIVDHEAQLPGWDVQAGIRLQVWNGVSKRGPERLTRPGRCTGCVARGRPGHTRIAYSLTISYS